MKLNLKLSCLVFSPIGFAGHYITSDTNSVINSIQYQKFAGILRDHKLHEIKPDHESPHFDKFLRKMPLI